MIGAVIDRRRCPRTLVRGPRIRGRFTAIRCPRNLVRGPMSAHPGHQARASVATRPAHPWPVYCDAVPGPRSQARAPWSQARSPRAPVFRPGPPAIGSLSQALGPESIARPEQARVTGSGAGAMFLSNIHQEKRMNVNCLIFVQKIAYNQSREPCAAIRYSSIKTKGPL
jgi:hypothetical protein